MTKEDSIFDIALETKWKNSTIVLVTVSKLRKLLLNSADLSVPKMIEKFIDEREEDNTEVAVSIFSSKLNCQSFENFSS